VIVGRLSDVPKQKMILPAAILRALEVLLTIDLGKKEPGRYELEGDKLFYMVQDTELRLIEDSRAEAHTQYADIQIPVSTSERFGFSVPQADLVSVDDQTETRDLAFYPDPANEFFMNVNPGSYAVFLPKELHRPCLAVTEKKKIRKVVVKVHASLLGL
jgi:biofilm protein TabA